MEHPIMWILMDSWWQGQAGQLLEKLQQNLPLTVATTIVMSLLVGFYKQLLRFIKRQLGLIEPPKDPLQPYLPEGDVAHTYTADKFRLGFTVDWGWRAALVDAGVVQCELEPRRYRRGTIAKMIAKMGLGENARAIVWRDKEFPVNLYLADLFASDHQPIQMEVNSMFHIDAARLLRSSLQELALPPAEISKHISSKMALSVQPWIASMRAEDFYHQTDKLAEWSELAKAWIRQALEGSPFEVMRVVNLRIFSPALDKVFKEYGEMALASEAARREVERNKVRGALRQAVLSGKLEEIHDQTEHEDAIRMIEQERALKEKALRQELDQSEIQELESRLRLWKRKHEILMEALGPVKAGSPNGAEITQRLTDTMARAASDAADSPFSAHEREQIRTVLQSLRTQGARPDEMLAAIAKGADIPCSLFDPLSSIRGAHTLRIGDGWRIFDGASLWQIRLTRIWTRRHGFLWLKESPAKAHFEMRGAPDKRQFVQDVVLEKSFELSVGSHTIPVEFLGGTPSRISLRIPSESKK
jgi:hypothetical protein